MTTIVTRAGKGSPLTNTEVDSNFSNLNSDKQEVLTEGAFVDGDKTKLDGIESGATADQTAQEIATAIDADATAEATLKSALGLGTAAYTASTDYATAAQGSLADSALQDVVDDTTPQLGGVLDTNGNDIQIKYGDLIDFRADGGASSSGTMSASASGTLQAYASNYDFNITGTGQVLDIASTGIDVTGTVTADGLTVNGDGLFDSNTAKVTIKSLQPKLILDDDTAVGAGSDKLIIQSASPQSAGDYEFVLNNDQTSSADQTAIKISGNGDISFYEDTGTTAKFFWDADAESLGIGTQSPATALHVAGDTTFGGAIDETVYNLTGTALDPSNGTIQYKTLAANTTLTDSLAEGESMTLMIDDGSAYTITWPTMTWVNNGGSAPTLATTGYTTVALWKVSTTLYGALVGDGT